MNNKREEQPFWNSFIDQPVVTEWQNELYQYYILGLEPGSFHYSLFCNDLAEAARHTHPMNEWSNIVEYMEWLCYEPPENTWGSRKVVDEWLLLNNRERRKILREHGWILSKKQVTWNILNEPASSRH